MTANIWYRCLALLNPPNIFNLERDLEQHWIWCFYYCYVFFTLLGGIYLLWCNYFIINLEPLREWCKEWLVFLFIFDRVVTFRETSDVHNHNFMINLQGCTLGITYCPIVIWKYRVILFKKCTQTHTELSLQARVDARIFHRVLKNSDGTAQRWRYWSRSRVSKVSGQWGGWGHTGCAAAWATFS